MLSVNTLLLPLFIKKTRGLDKVIEKTLLKCPFMSKKVSKKVSQVYTDTFYSRLVLVRPNRLYVRPNFVPGVTYDRLIEIICRLDIVASSATDNPNKQQMAMNVPKSSSCLVVQLNCNIL